MLIYVAGTRPEVIKLAPLIRLCIKRSVPFQCILTGQHADLIASTGIDAIWPIRLTLPSQNDPMAYCDAATERLSEVLHGQKSDSIVVVQGDTASALAGARAGVQQNLRVAHVEAGLRSGNLQDPWPEEGFRVEIDRLSTHRFCPTDGNLVNLTIEGLSGVVTGNTVTDALRLAGITPVKPVHRENGPVVVTLHRRESFGQPLLDIIAGLSQVAASFPDRAFCWPVHPNPKVQEALDQSPLPVNILRRSPLPYPKFIEFLSRSRCVLTDSGGLVEECSTLGIPVAVARDCTERPEACEVGTARLAGKSTAGVVEALQWALSDEALWGTLPSDVFGDGHAAERIVKHFT